MEAINWIVGNIADLFSSFFDGLMNFFNEIAGIYVDLAYGALEELGFTQEFQAMKATGIVQEAFNYVPLIQNLVYWNTVTLIFSAEFAILVGLIIFKVIVKLIPAVW